jgi:DNA-binding transcriptional LysR family regulator
MNLKQLLFAQTVADCKSFSRAAELCHATQPTLSNAISQLEQELGDKLFVRTTRKVGLTAFGEYVLPYIAEVLNSKTELEQAAHAYHNPEQSILRIGLSPLIDMKLLTQVLAPYRKAHPDISVFFKECLLDDLSERLANEQIDFAIMPVNVGVTQVNAAAFYQEPLYYIPQEDQDYDADVSHYRIDRLPDASIIMTGGGCGLNGSLDNLFQADKVHLNRYPGQALSYKIIEEWASLGIGAGILPKAKMSADNKAARPLTHANGKLVTFSYEWLWGRHVANRKDLSQFAAYLKTRVPALVKGASPAATA